MICFQLSEKISQTFPLATFAEDAFEVVACYFPIDFNPPKNDPFGITRDKLVDGLKKAMIASPMFAQYCLPLLIEKLSSDLARCVSLSEPSQVSLSEFSFPSLSAFQFDFLHRGS